VKAIAPTPRSPLSETINLALLDAVESEWWQQTLFRYLGVK